MDDIALEQLQQQLAAMDRKIEALQFHLNVYRVREEHAHDRIQRLQRELLEERYRNDHIPEGEDSSNTDG